MDVAATMRAVGVQDAPPTTDGRPSKTPMTRDRLSVVSPAGMCATPSIQATAHDSRYTTSAGPTWRASKSRIPDVRHMQARSTQACAWRMSSASGTAVPTMSTNKGAWRNRNARSRQVP